MPLVKWKIRNNIVSLPDTWNKSQVISFMNTDVKVCTYCGKVDIPINHYENGCNPNFIKNQENFNN